MAGLFSEGFRGEAVSLLSLASGGLLLSLAHGPFLESLQPLASVIAFPTTDSDPPTYLLYGPL